MNEKIDLSKAKKLTRILSGKEKAPSKHATKLREVQLQMTAKEIAKDVTELKEMIKASNPDDFFAREVYLFAFRGKFYQVESGSYKIITDKDVKALLDEVPETKVYYLCTNKGMCPLPPALSGLKDATGVQVKNDQGVIDYIKQVTGVTIKLK